MAIQSSGLFDSLVRGIGSEIDEPCLRLEVVLPGRVVVEVVAADIGERGDVELASADALLHKRMRRGLDHDALRARFDLPAQPRLYLRRFRRRLSAYVVDLATADLEGHRAHRASQNPAGLKDVLRHVCHRGLAVGPSDPRELEPPGWPSKELGGKLRQSGASR